MPGRSIAARVIQSVPPSDGDSPLRSTRAGRSTVTHSVGTRGSRSSVRKAILAALGLSDWILWRWKSRSKRLPSFQTHEDTFVSEYYMKAIPGDFPQSARARYCELNRLYSLRFIAR